MLLMELYWRVPEAPSAALLQCQRMVIQVSSSILTVHPLVHSVLQPPALGRVNYLLPDEYPILLWHIHAACAVLINHVDVSLLSD